MNDIETIYVGKLKMMQRKTFGKFELFRASGNDCAVRIRRAIEVQNSSRLESKLIAAIASKSDGVAHFITNDDEQLREAGIEGVSSLEDAFMTFDDEESVFNELESIEYNRRNLQLVLYKPRVDSERQAVFLDHHCQYEYQSLR